MQIVYKSEKITVPNNKALLKIEILVRPYLMAPTNSADRVLNDHQQNLGKVPKIREVVNYIIFQRSVTIA
jgi:hypothetical protein